MRKVLIASAVALVLFSVGAFAASFLVNSEDIASGTDDVVACASSVDVDFDTEYDADVSDWRVTGATVTFVDNEASPGNCDGFDATLVVETTTEGASTTVVDAQAATGTSVVSGGTAEFEFSSSLLVRDVTGASVLVDGENLDAETSL